MGNFDNRNKGYGGKSSGGYNRDGGSRGGDRGGFRGNFGPKEMHKATCSECGNECEVPFKPTEGKPVFCKECFMKHKKY